MFPTLNTIGSTITSNPIDCQYINDIIVTNGIYDDLYATRIDENIKEPESFVIPDEWDSATYLHAKFNGDIFSGNSNFGVENTTNILIKRRIKGTYQWMPLFDILASSSADYNFVVIDPYGASGVTYEYAAVPIINGVENNYSIMECTVTFDNLIIIDPDETYGTPFDVSLSLTKNNTSSTILPIESKYPIYVANAINDYYTGNISATFINMVGCEVDEDTNHMEYRDKIMSFLNNRNIKYIKHPKGQCWLASIGTTIEDTDNGTPYTHSLSFDFTEVGDIYSNEDMDKFGMLDVGEEWW
jgi:hypothetical protein